jgi:hypothetical protein
MKTDPLQEFILKDEQNLRIAVAVSEAWPDVRSRITTTFLDRLTTKLVKELPGWATETWETCFEHAYASFQLYKPTWEYYWVDLQFRDCGQNMRLGIVREESLVSDRPFSPDILEAVRKIYPSAKQAKWWEAIIVLRSPATDWRTPDVLWRMHTDSSFLDTVAEQMVALAKATEFILDRLHKKKS